MFALPQLKPFYAYRGVFSERCIRDVVYDENQEGLVKRKTMPYSS